MDEDASGYIPPHVQPTHVLDVDVDRGYNSPHVHETYMDEVAGGTNPPYVEEPHVDEDPDEEPHVEEDPGGHSPPYMEEPHVEAIHVSNAAETDVAVEAHVESHEHGGHNYDPQIHTPPILALLARLNNFDDDDVWVIPMDVGSVRGGDEV